MRVLGLVLAGVFLLSACSGGSGGGRFRAVGKVCPVNYQPYTSKDVKGAQEIDVLSGEKLPKGEYQYVSSDIICTYDHTILHVRHYKARPYKRAPKRFQPTRVCVRGVGQSFSFQIPVVTAFSFKDDKGKSIHDPQVQLAYLGIDFGPTKNKMIWEKDPSKSKETFSSVLNKYAQVEEMYLYRHSASKKDPGDESYNMELRGVVLDEAGKKYQVIVRYLFKPEGSDDE
ncbi:MAG: hypothetical protein D6797_07760 [Bdellovibrio sp.]|nr:MAG: hypothetical protein D6797_07760 [Bdellovibrio sp.]